LDLLHNYDVYICGSGSCRGVHRHGTWCVQVHIEVAHECKNASMYCSCVVCMLNGCVTIDFTFYHFST